MSGRRISDLAFGPLAWAVVPLLIRAAEWQDRRQGRTEWFR